MMSSEIQILGSWSEFQWISCSLVYVYGYIISLVISKPLQWPDLVLVTCNDHRMTTSRRQPDRASLRQGRARLRPSHRNWAQQEQNGDWHVFPRVLLSVETGRHRHQWTRFSCQMDTKEKNVAVIKGSLSFSTLRSTKWTIEIPPKEPWGPLSYLRLWTGKWALMKQLGGLSGPWVGYPKISVLRGTDSLFQPIAQLRKHLLESLEGLKNAEEVDDSCNMLQHFVCRIPLPGWFGAWSNFHSPKTGMESYMWKL